MQKLEILKNIIECSIYGDIFTWGSIKKAALWGDDAHPVEELRVGQRQLNYLNGECKVRLCKQDNSGESEGHGTGRWHVPLGALGSAPTGPRSQSRTHSPGPRGTCYIPKDPLLWVDTCNSRSQMNQNLNAPNTQHLTRKQRISVSEFSNLSWGGEGNA